MTKTLSDRAQKAADTRAKNAELTQREAEQLASETKGKLNCLKTWRFELTECLTNRWARCEEEGAQKSRYVTVTRQEVTFKTDIGTV